MKLVLRLRARSAPRRESPSVIPMSDRSKSLAGLMCPLSLLSWVAVFAVEEWTTSASTSALSPSGEDFRV